MAKYKDKANEDQIIGHFGLGFYSAFMVADKVTIDYPVLSEGRESPCTGSPRAASILRWQRATRTEVGTTIALYLNEDSTEFSNEYRAREVIEKVLRVHACNDFPGQ